MQGTTDQVDVNVIGSRETDGRGAARRGFRQRRRSDPFGIGLAEQHFRFGQARVGPGQLEQDQHDLLAVVHRPVLDRRWRKPRLRPLSAEVERRCQPVWATTRPRRRAGQLRFGVPITEFDTINYGLRLRKHEHHHLPRQPAYLHRLRRHVRIVEYQRILAPPAGCATSRDSLIYPTKGSLHKASVGVGTPAGSSGTTTRRTISTSATFPLTRDYTFMLNGELGYGDGYGDRRHAAFLQELLRRRGNRHCAASASSRSVRRTPTAIRAGGSRKLLGNAEFLFPFPGLQTTGRSG